MKKTTLITLAFAILFIGQQAIAQSGLGIRGGFVVSDQKVKILSAFDANLKSKVGLDLALLYNMEFENGMSFQPGVHYTQMGSVADVGVSEVKGEFDYIRIPLLLKYDVLSTNESFDLSPFAGPYVAFLINEDVDYLSIVLDDLKMKTLDIGADFGLMLKHSSGLFIDVRYMLGLTDISKVEVFGLNIGELKNSAIGVGIGYIF